MGQSEAFFKLAKWSTTILSCCNQTQWQIDKIKGNKEVNKEVNKEEATMKKYAKALAMNKSDLKTQLDSYLELKLNVGV